MVSTTTMCAQTWVKPTENLPKITFDGVEEEFVPLQTHFHHFLSEHTIDGVHYPLETHLVSTG
jgi:carbonic anhydrase